MYSRASPPVQIFFLFFILNTRFASMIKMKKKKKKEREKEYIGRAIIIGKSRIFFQDTRVIFNNF